MLKKTTLYQCFLYRKRQVNVLAWFLTTRETLAIWISSTNGFISRVPRGIAGTCFNGFQYIFPILRILRIICFHWILRILRILCIQRYICNLDLWSRMIRWTCWTFWQKVGLLRKSNFSAALISYQKWRWIESNWTSW